MKHESLPGHQYVLTARSTTFHLPRPGAPKTPVCGRTRRRSHSSEREYMRKKLHVLAGQYELCGTCRNLIVEHDHDYERYRSDPEIEFLTRCGVL